MKRWFITMVVFVLLLAVQACSGVVGGGKSQIPNAGKTTPETESVTAAPAELATSAPTPTSEAKYVDLSDYPTLATITASPEVAGSGEQIELASGFPLTGMLQIQGPEDTKLQLKMEAGKALLDLPAQAPAGVYTLIYTDQGNNFATGTFRLASKPGIWLAVDRSFVMPGQAARLHVSSWGVPEDTPVEVDVHGSLFAINQLGPDPQTGQLMPFRFDQPPHLGDLLGRTWTLPQGISGDVDVVAREDLSSDGNGFTSNTMKVRSCSSPSYIKGDLGESGQIRAIWEQGGIRVVSTATQDGPFLVEAGPGLVLLEVQRLGSGTSGARSTQAVRLDCGETVDVGMADLKLKASLQEAYPFLGFTLEDLGGYTATSTGNLAFEHKGFTECDLTDNTLTVKLDPGSDTPMLYQFEAPGVSGSGEYQAVFDLTDIFKGDSSGPGTLKVVIDKVEDMMGVKGSFTASYDGDAGRGEITGDFSCFYIPPLANNLQNEDQGYAQVLGGKKSLAVLSTAAQAPSASDKTCRAGIIAYPNDDISSILGEVLATTLFKTTPRLSVLTTADVQALLGLQAERLLLGADDAEVQAALDAIAGSMGADFSFWLRMDQLDSQYVLNITAIRVRDARVIARGSRSGTNLEEVAFSDLYQEIAAKMQKADICGKIDPTELDLNHGEDAKINFTVTDLHGDEVNGAEVTTKPSTCGSLDPSQGNTGAGEFSTIFKANQDAKPCNEQLQFTAKAQMPSGSVETRSVEGQVGVSVSDQWTLEMEMNLNPVGLQDNDIKINWHGNFHVSSSGKLVGSGNGVVQGDIPDYPCVILDFDQGDIRTEPNPATLDGDFHFYIYGEANEQSDHNIFNVDPLGVSVPLQYTFGNQACAEGATYDPITGPIVSMAAKQPVFMVGLQQLVLEAKDGATVKQTSTSGFPATLTVTLHRPGGNKP
jgi:hypothetical protein